MSYVAHILQPGEVVRYRSKIHWMVFLPGVLLLAVALALYVVSGNSGFWHGVFIVLASLSLAAALAILFFAWFRRWTTEIAVTNRRIIYKTGFISRHTNEMNLDKVESVDVDQSLFGRLLDYGNIDIRGTGSGFERLRKIEAPIEFRNHVTVH
jgi:uncharacterized membrane protein YdbT with pleckstrin-like domain